MVCGFFRSQFSIYQGFMDSSLDAQTQEPCWALSCNLVHVDSAEQWGAGFQYCQQEAIRQWRLRGEGFLSPAWLAPRKSFICLQGFHITGVATSSNCSSEESAGPGFGWFYQLLSQHLLPTEPRPFQEKKAKRC